VFTYLVLDQASIDGNGYTGSFWLVGLTVYTAVILVVTFKLASHTRFWSVILFITITVLSVGLYVLYMWISNWALSNYVEGTTYIAYTSGNYYFIVLFCICMILFVDGAVIFMDFKQGAYASKMR
jgi:phospholipid-transporting ATPase